MAAPAKADRGELYTLVGYDAGVSHHQVPVPGHAVATQYSGAIAAIAYYGVSNSLHVGGRVGFSSSSNLRFGGVSVTKADGTTATGNVFLDDLRIDGGAIVLWRVGTGHALAPAVELGAGVAVHEYRNITQYPSDAGVAVPLGSRSEVVAYGSGTVLVEYRFGNHWMAAVGVGARVEAGRMPWAVFVPFRVGRIW